MNVERPIFILGPPRSGTSLLYKTLAVHPDLAWFNRNFKRLPEWPRLARFLTAVRSPMCHRSRVWFGTGFSHETTIS